MPKTLLGKWSVGLIVLFFVLLGSGRFVAQATGGGGETFFDNIPLALTMLGAGLSGASAFVVGLFGVIKQRERSALVYVAMLIGFLVLAFALGEFFGPEH